MPNVSLIEEADVMIKIQSVTKFQWNLSHRVKFSTFSIFEDLISKFQFDNWQSTFIPIGCTVGNYLYKNICNSQRWSVHAVALFMIFELLVYCGVYRLQLNISPLLFILGFFLNLYYYAKFKSVPHPYIWPIRKSIFVRYDRSPNQIRDFPIQIQFVVLLCLLYCEYEF